MPAKTAARPRALPIASACALLLTSTALGGFGDDPGGLLLNHSGEINDGIDGAPISDPAVIGWDSNGGRVFNDGIDYGNGGWRLSFEDSQHVRQMTAHVIETGASYSLRFDASLSGGDALSRVTIAELYVEDDTGIPITAATHTFEFKTPIPGAWDHYHMAVPAGSLDAHAGKTLGVRFRSDGAGIDNTQSIDNVRLDSWPASPLDGSFTDDWNTTSDQVWIGPGYWANRLHDWHVSSGRVNCIDSDRPRRTIHRTGTSIRGNGGKFSFSVRTGLYAGNNGSLARTGFLLGAGPNLDWRGALLVQGSLGRDFGLFLGLNGDGAVVIEDYSTGSVTTLASGTSFAFVDDTRLELAALHSPTTGEYTLTLSAFDASDALLSTTSTKVPSDRVLGSFGLLSDRGDQTARFWFDDFSGTGLALQPEGDRHLAIIGAMHTLSRGKLKITAQLPPLALDGNPTVAFDTWDGSTWQEVATAPIDNTDGLSSYTATFSISTWDDREDTDYRLRIEVGGTDHSWTGTVRHDPIEKNEIVLALTNCQRLADQRVDSAENVDWSPVDIWQPHTLAFAHIAKHQPDVFLALGDQIYEHQPTAPDNSSDFNRHHDYLYKWYLWVLQVREITRDIPTIAIPDDHDIYQGNLWGEGGVPTGNQNEGGYLRPATWVKMVERTQTSNLPDADPYNPLQPPPTVAQGIEVYFTRMVYGRLGFAILEDRKFKTGPSNAPSDPDEQVLLGDRQHDFLRAWAKDWAGQDIKLVTSQSAFGNLNTHSGPGYHFSLNDRDTHGWPVHRRNEAWKLLRSSRMFQLAGDQHLATVAQHGSDSAGDAGFTFTGPAMANFFPRAWDPVHNADGPIRSVSSYLGDFYFDGSGNLPDGVTPNLSAADPAHVAMHAVANPLQYYQLTTGINPPNLHDRGAGYGIIRTDKTTRHITFECWPHHADPEFPQTGSQFPDWPITISQTDNDGRLVAGYLPVIDTLWLENAVVSVYDESNGALAYSMRVRGNLFRPPVYDDATTYRVEISHSDGPVSEILTGLAPSALGAPSILSFAAIQPSIASGDSSTLRWNVENPSVLTIDQGIGEVSAFTVDGIGYLEVSPESDTTYTLKLDGSLTAMTTVHVGPRRRSGGAETEALR